MSTLADSTEGDYMAAVLAGGGGARLSHAPSSHLLRLEKGPAPPPEVTVPTLSHRRRPGIVIHRVRVLPVQDVSEYRGIPITARNPHKPGAAKLRRALLADVTLSDLERGFVKLLKAHRLPLPRTSIDHHGDKVDCHWPDLDLTIELVSFRFHATRRAWEDDVARRRRSTHLAYSYGDVFERASATIADLTPRLALRR
jgi:hypothetical protein